MFRLLGSVLAVALVIARPIQADNTKKADEETQKALSKIAELGPGVHPHTIKKDKKGRITSCIVVGQARISTVLGKAKGLVVARQKAELDAKAQFVKWLKETVSIHQKSEEETILFIEGSEDNDKDALKESGKAVEKTARKIEAVSSGLVRGLQVLHIERSGKDKTYTLVMGWDAETAEATKKVDKVLKGSDPKKPGKDEPKEKSEKKIEDKKATSPDAKKFLP